MLGKGKQTTPKVVCLCFGAKFRGILDLPQVLISILFLSKHELSH